jgi:hypothetical protein
MKQLLCHDSRFLIAFVLIMSCCKSVSLADDNDFYAHRDEVMGIEIKAPEMVDPAALKVAKLGISIMLRNRPDIADRMQNRKASLAIIPHRSFITVLPEFKRLSGKNDPNGNPYDSFKVRGAGGVRSQPVTATSEENLLRLDGDAFAAESVTCHEFAHAIMNLGFSDEEHRRWKAIYEAAKQQDLFPGAFAMTSADEYWAELSQSYFGVNNEINGLLAIQRSDPDAFRFLEEIYGSDSSSTKNRQRKKPK